MVRLRLWVRLNFNVAGSRSRSLRGPAGCGRRRGGRSRGWGLRVVAVMRLPGGEAGGDFGVGDEEVDAAGFDVEGDAVAGADDGERAADGGLGRDVEDDGAEGGAGHAGVGDADHVLDAGAGEFERDGQVAGFGHARARRRGRRCGGRGCRRRATSRSGRSMRAARSSSESKTTARPVWRRRCGEAAECLMTAERGARLPWRMAMAPSFLSGAARVRMTSWLGTSSASAMISARVKPEMVGAEVSRSGLSSRSRAGRPPAWWRCSM